MKQRKEQTCGHITITTIDKTGQRRQLTDVEVAAKMKAILEMDPVERVRMCFPVTEQKEAQ